MSRGKWAHVHAEAAELAAELRQQPQDQTARVASLEKRKRKQDEPARRAFANQSLALRFFVQFVGYDPAIADTLRAAIEAAAGLDHAITRVDWEMGLYLRGATPEEAARIRALPARHKEKNTLAKAWTRAFAEYEAEEKRTGIVALRRIPGSKNFKTGNQKASQLHALVAQDLAEIAAAAMKVHGKKRFERFAEATAAHVRILRDDLNRRASTVEKETRPPRIKQPDTPALAVVRFLNRVEKAVDELLRDVPAEMREEARQHAETLIAQKFAGDVSEEGGEEATGGRGFVHPDLKKERWTNSAEADPPADRKMSDTKNAAPAKNAASGAGMVDNLSNPPPPKSPPAANYETYRKAITFAIDERMRAGASLDEAAAEVEAQIGNYDGWLERVQGYGRRTLHTCPSPDVLPEFIEERVAIMCEAGGVSETEAAQAARHELCEVCQQAARLARSQVTELEYAPGKFM